MSSRAPWETTEALWADINRTQGYNLDLPTTFLGSNHIYVISVSPSGGAELVTFFADLAPSDDYPALPSPVPGSPCNQQTPFRLVRTGGVNGVVVPADSNTNQTVYLIRHAEAHPTAAFENGNYVGKGQWRALALADALSGKISPDLVYSIDPCAVVLGGRLQFFICQTLINHTALRRCQQFALSPGRRLFYRDGGRSRRSQVHQRLLFHRRKFLGPNHPGGLGTRTFPAAHNRTPGELRRRRSGPDIILAADRLRYNLDRNPRRQGQRNRG